MSLLTAFLADGALNARIAADVAAAELAEGGNVRADSRRSPPAVAAQRAAIAHMVRTMDAIHERPAKSGARRADSARLREVAVRVAEALGLREVDGRIDGTEGRADSTYLPGELIVRDRNPLRVRDQRRALIEGLPSRNVDAGATHYQSAGIDYEGAAADYQPGTTQIPRADFGVSAKNQPIHTIVCKTEIDWLEALHGSMSAINGPAEKAAAADRTLAISLESLLANGRAGVDVRSLYGASKLTLVTSVSTVDFSRSNGTLTLGQIWKALSDLLLDIREKNKMRGGVADSLLIAPEIVHAIVSRTNYDSGGQVKGADLITGLNQLGIRNIIEAPSLSVVTAPDGTTTASKYAGIVPFEGGNPDSIRRVTALPTAPVRTAESLTGTETLWAYRTGGLECRDATSAGLGYIQVRA